MTNSVHRLAVCRRRLVWSSVCRSWRERCERNRGAWGEKEGLISGRLCLMSCRRWHSLHSSAVIPHLPTDTTIRSERRLKNNLEMTSWYLKSMEGFDRNRSGGTNLYFYFVYLSEALHFIHCVTNAVSIQVKIKPHKQKYHTKADQITPKHTREAAVWKETSGCRRHINTRLQKRTKQAKNIRHHIWHEDFR